MRNGRLEGIIRWSIFDRDAAIISHSSGDYHADFMDLTCLRRPEDGERVTFLPQEQRGVLRARAIELRAGPVRSGPSNPRAAPASPAQIRAAYTHAVLPRRVTCHGCDSLVVPRSKPLGSRGRFATLCPKCGGRLGGDRGASPRVGVISTLLIGLTVLLSLLAWP